MIEARIDFTPHPRYPELMAGMHRKPPTQIGAPAVTQHLGFWIPDLFVNNRQTWVRNVESFILGIFDRLNSQLTFDLKTVSLTTDAIGISRLYLLDNEYAADSIVREQEQAQAPADLGKAPSRYQTVRFAFHWHTMPVEISVELHNEYFTLSTSIDLSRWDNQAGDGPAAELTEALRKFNEATTGRFREIQRTQKPIPRPEDQAKLSAPYKALYYDIWRKFCLEVFGPLCATTGGDGNIGGKFVEFRNLVLSRAETSFIAAPGSAPKDRLLDTLERRAFDEQELVECVETILPFVTLGAGESHESMEYTFSTFLDRRCLHASALGGQPTVDANSKESVHVDFFLTPYNDRWQIGRMIERGNTMGTLRVAALYDLEHLVKVNGELRKLEGRLEEVSKALPNAHDRDAEIKSQVADLSDISKDLTKAGKDISVGLPYRVERSRYYRQQFLELAETLLQDRVEGSQPYLDFVTRRLGPTFDFINMVGTRYARLQEHATNLHRHLTNAKLLGLQTQITEQATTIKSIQKNAERFFFLVLFPYYAAFFFLKAFDDLPVLKYPILGLAAVVGLIFAFKDKSIALLGKAKSIVKRATAYVSDKFSNMLEAGRRFFSTTRKKCETGLSTASGWCRSHLSADNDRPKN